MRPRITQIASVGGPVLVRGETGSGKELVARAVRDASPRADKAYIDMDSYRPEKRAMMRIALADEDAEVTPLPPGGGGGKPEPELDQLSRIIAVFNDHWGSIPWEDADRVRRMITVEIPERVDRDTAYQNARRNSDPDNARIEHDRALQRVIVALMRDDTELFKQFMDNPSFRRWLSDTVFAETYRPAVAG